MLDKLKLSGWLILLSVTTASIVFFITGKGINIDKRSYVDQTQHQEQYSYQGQLFIQNGFTQGNKLVWKCKSIPNEKAIITEMEATLNALPPQYSIPSKQFYHPATGLVNCVGEFMTEVKK